MVRTFDTSLRLQTVEGENASGSLQGVVYAYDTARRLQSRYCVRTAVGVTNRVGTTCGGDAAGDLATVAYANDPSSTLGIKYIRDRLGRLEQAERHTYRVTAPNMSDGNRVSCATLTYNDAGQPLTEAYSEGTLAAFSIEWTYDTYLRRQTVTARNGGASLQAATSAYDTAGRLSSVSDGTYSATYAYHPNSSLLNTVTFKQNTTPALTTTRTYDKLNRLQQIGSAPSGASAKGNGVPSK